MDEDNWSCPDCGEINPEVETLKTPGFTGAPIYSWTFQCCGRQEVDASADSLEAAE